MMAGEENDSGKKWKQPRWAVVLAILIPSISSAGAAWYGLIVGDPEAKERSRKTWTTLSDAYRKLHLNVVHMQGQLEGYNNAKLVLKIEELEKKNEKLKQVAVAPKPTNATATNPVKVAKKPVVEVLRGDKTEERKLKPCHPGWVRIDDKCTKSRAKIAKVVEETRAKLAVETRKRKALELKKKWLQKKMQMQMQAPRPAPAPKPAPLLPEDLDEASKKAGK